MSYENGAVRRTIRVDAAILNKNQKIQRVVSNVSPGSMRPMGHRLTTPDLRRQKGKVPFSRPQGPASAIAGQWLCG